MSVVIGATCVKCGQAYEASTRDPRGFPFVSDINLDECCTPCYLAAAKAAGHWNGLTVGIHWLAFTTRLPAYEMFAALALAVYGCGADVAASLFTQMNRGGYGYEAQLVGLNSVQIYMSEGREDKFVVLPGGACEVMSVNAIIGLLALKLTTFKRIDLAIDGAMRKGKPLSVGWIANMCFDRPELVKTRVQLTAKPDARTGRYPENRRFIRGNNGRTFYLGSPQSPRMARFYDSRGMTRIELQCREETAVAVAEILDGRRADEVPKVVVGLLRGFVEFVRPRSQKCKAGLQPWWRQVVKDTKRMTLSMPRHKPKLDETWMHYLRQWPTTLAAFVKASGGDIQLLLDLVDKGSKKMTARHEQMIKEACPAGVGTWVPSWV